MWLSYFINTKPFNTMYIEFFQIIYASGIAVSITVVIIHSEYFVYWQEACLIITKHYNVNVVLAESSILYILLS